jgi:hypothetical protein
MTSSDESAKKYMNQLPVATNKSNYLRDVLLVIPPADHIYRGSMINGHEV